MMQSMHVYIEQGMQQFVEQVEVDLRLPGEATATQLEDHLVIAEGTLVGNGSNASMGVALVV